MQFGASRKLLDLWAPDPRNGVIVTGFSVEKRQYPYATES